jgi:hypothetical protein
MVERTRREARLDAHDGVDDPHRHTRPRQSGAHLLLRDNKEPERPGCDFGDEDRAFRTRQAFGAGSVSSTSDGSIEARLMVCLLVSFDLYRITDASSKLSRGLRGWRLLGSP